MTDLWNRALRSAFDHARALEPRAVGSIYGQCSELLIAHAVVDARVAVGGYTKQQPLLISRLHLKRDVFMFPYRTSTSKLLFKGLRLIYGRGGRGSR